MDSEREAIEVLKQWLFETYQDADLVDILNSHPESQEWTDEEFDRVLDSMRNIKLTQVHLQ